MSLACIGWPACDKVPHRPSACQEKSEAGGGQAGQGPAEEWTASDLGLDEKSCPGGSQGPQERGLKLACQPAVRHQTRTSLS